ncbi:hypothetical protein Baya_14058 [Bagarius yarrelli]|uniref:Uncharacterized protein n=1 Tax=Bagarius yarrelli TaxID=175774 RepID=A0A556V7L1_BAGYA|nr:hypothetical protein Baya_14058 [Bagarius yarrelli]
MGLPRKPLIGRASVYACVRKRTLTEAKHSQYKHTPPPQHTNFKHYFARGSQQPLARISQKASLEMTHNMSYDKKNGKQPLKSYEALNPPVTSEKPRRNLGETSEISD